MATTKFAEKLIQKYGVKLNSNVERDAQMDLICEIIDRDGDGEVSPTELVEFVHLFGPIETSYEKVTQGLLFKPSGSTAPLQVNWFVYMNREEAQFHLRDEGRPRVSAASSIWIPIWIWALFFFASAMCNCTMCFVSSWILVF